MTIFLIVLALAVTALMVYGVLLVLRGDGYGARTGHRPPVSHHADPFDPHNRSRLA